MAHVLILGATSAIARSVAHEYARSGQEIILAARDISKIEDDVKDINVRFGVDVKAVCFEATEIASHEDFVKALGVIPDVVVCAVGILGEQARAENDFSEVRRLYETNVLGCVSILDIFARLFAERGFGSIIGIASVAGDRGRVANYYYGSTKAALAAYLSGLRVRMFKVGVHVMTVKPGFVRTAMTRHMTLPAALTADPVPVGKAIYRAALRRRSCVYTPGYWRLIMFVVRFLPEIIFKRMKL